MLGKSKFIWSAAMVSAMLAGQTQANEDGKCYALVLSGGGTNGAWEAGVIWGLMNYGDPTNFEYD